MKLSKPVPRIRPFDRRDPDKVTLYPFPWPDGQRVVVVTNGTEVHVYDVAGDATGTSLNGFSLALEDEFRKLYSSLYSEPNPRFTRNGVQVNFPWHAFDAMLYDKDNGGRADKLRSLMSDWCFDPGWPAPAEDVAAMIIAHMPYDHFLRGADTVDMWQRRADLKRALIRMGAANPYSVPSPILRFPVIAPYSWDWPLQGCAGSSRVRFWVQVQNCFDAGFGGCLVVDVWQPWSVRGDAFQLITDEESI